ncbi:hypothetical protein AMJ39_00320 [candidate division TA06 bacterium DG_24]|uniref:Tetratricopeptide repeat protein n=1 Tax=candidate division TA06 bacterium DG_24 TaxID=1703770 RepID=A0A0S7WWG1_UNCT6|nr:MAG: hypothetical protein AMJ39_00320 [candidate division TA06 bacterium DG_24]
MNVGRPSVVAQERLTLSVLSLLFLVSAGACRGAEQPADSLSLVVEWGLDFAYHEEYEDAMEMFRQAERFDPGGPASPFFQAGLLEMRMVDYGTDDGEEEFMALIGETIRRASGQLKDDPENAWSHFFLGSAYGYRATHQVRKARYLSAFRDGMRAIGSLGRAVECDSTLYDAYLGLGGYHYLKTKLARFLTWLPFVPDDRERGMEEVRLAMERGKYARIAAQDALIWFLVEEQRHEEAVALVSDLVAAYPDSRTFAWSSARVMEAKEDWQRAEQAWRRLLELILEDEKASSSLNLVTCRYGLAEALYELERYDEALEECRAVLILARNPDPDKRFAQIIEQAWDLLRRTEEKIAEIGTGEKLVGER